MRSYWVGAAGDDPPEGDAEGLVHPTLTEPTGSHDLSGVYAGQV